MTRIPQNPPVIFRGPFVRCALYGEPGTPDHANGAEVHAVKRVQWPRDALPSLGHRSLGALAPPAWSRAPAPAMPPRPDPPGLRLVVSTPDGDPPVRSGAAVHVLPRR